MGLVAAAFVCSFHFPTGGIRSELQTRSLQVLIPALIPLANAMGQRVDFGAHLGGALGGALMGAVILGVWPRTDPVPRFRSLAAAVIDRRARGGARGRDVCARRLCQGQPRPGPARLSDPYRAAAQDERRRDLAVGGSRGAIPGIRARTCIGLQPSKRRAI